MPILTVKSPLTSNHQESAMSSELLIEDIVVGDGKAVVTSDGPKGNVGFPAAPHEIAHFRAMLEQSKRRLTDADINALVASLEEANRK